MKRILIAILLMVAIVAGVCAQYRPNRSPHEAMERLRETVMNRDFDGFADCYWEDALKLEVLPEGFKIFHRGLDAIMGHQIELIEMYGPDIEFYLPPEGEWFMDTPQGWPEFVAWTPVSDVLVAFQFEERHGAWRVINHLEFPRYYEFVEVGPAQAWADDNNNWVLEPEEQEWLFEEVYAFRGPGPIESIIAESFNMNFDDELDEHEFFFGIMSFYRERLRMMYRYNPIFAEQYIDFDHNGGISYYEANPILGMIFDDMHEEAREVLNPEEARFDFNEDGFISIGELVGYSDLIRRGVAVLPDWGPSHVEELEQWLDANGDGRVSDIELDDLGAALQDLITHDVGVAVEPFSARFDRNEDGFLEPWEKEPARELFLREFLPRVFYEMYDFPEMREQINLLDLNDDNNLDDPEIEFFMELIGNLEHRIGSRPESPLEMRVDRDPRNRRLEEHEVGSLIGTVFTAIARFWADSPEYHNLHVALGSGPDSAQSWGEGRQPEDDGQEPDLETTAEMPDDEAGSSQTGTAETEADKREEQTTTELIQKLDVSFNVDNVFPVLFKYYDTTSFGTVTLINEGTVTLENIEVRLDMETYMDNPKLSGSIESLAAGAEQEIELFALFNKEVLSITEGTKVAANLIVEFEAGGTSGKEEKTVVVTFYDRNALRWDDDKKVSAFVTAKDDYIQRFAKNMTAAMSRHRRDALSKNLQRGMMLYTAMAEHGLSYQIDPNSSYKELSLDDANVDYLQFPKKTLDYRAGDCDDLSVCYNALLEAVGVQTAFITIPGHIYPAFGLEMSAAEAKKAFLRPDDLIIDTTGKVWLPVEITMVEESGFLDAWIAGAKEWRENYARGQAALYPTHDAWSVYQPVGFSDSTTDPTIPNTEEVVASFRDELDRWVKREIATRELEFLAKLEEKSDDHRSRNRLGVLYAQYGLNDKAQTEFQTIVETEDHMPALMNLGHLLYLTGEEQSALTYYNKALALSPDNPRAVLAVARANHDLENYGNVQSLYDKLKGLSPSLALKFNYLDLQSTNTSRASAPSELKGEVIWESEDEE